MEKKKRTKEQNVKKIKLHSQQTGPGIILESAPRNTIFCLFTETKWQTFRRIPGFYSTSGAVDYTAVIFCAHLVTVKCEFLTTTSIMEIQLCARPATQLMCSTLLPADFTRQSIAHARKSMWKGSILFVSARRKGHSHGGQRKRTWWTTGRTRGRTTQRRMGSWSTSCYFYRPFTKMKH